jgi:hypothetical protein
MRKGAHISGGEKCVQLAKGYSHKIYKQPRVWISGCRISRGSWPEGNRLVMMRSRASFVKDLNVCSTNVTSWFDSKNWMSSSTDVGVCWVFCVVEEPALPEEPARLFDLRTKGSSVSVCVACMVDGYWVTISEQVVR